MSTIFRSKSIDRISSPEQLNDYVRVSTPGVWMALIAIITLLIGVCVWGVLGTIDSTVQMVVWIEDGKAISYVKEADIDSIKIGQTAIINGNEYTIEGISDTPISLSEETDAYTMHIGSLSAGEWVYRVTISSALPDGVYQGKIVTQSFHPLSFLLD